MAGRDDAVNAPRADNSRLDIPLRTVHGATAAHLRILKLHNTVKGISSLCKLRPMFDPAVNKRGSVERSVALKLSCCIARRLHQIDIFLNVRVTQ